MQRLHQNVSFRVFAAADDPFAPNDVTRLTGLTPTDVRLRDLQRERPRNVSWWEFSPSSSGDINEKIEELSRSLHSAAAGLTDICGLQESELQLPIETGRQAVEIRIPAGLIDLLQVLGTEIDCDLYWPRKQQFIDGTCVHCGLSEMCSVAELRWSIGGQLHAAEWQARYSLSAPPPHAISKFSPDAPEYWPRLDRNLEAAYFESLDILQFSSDYWPCSGSIAEISAESHLSNFLDVLERYVGPLIGDARASSRVTISLLERGDFQGSAGLRFDKRSLERIHRLGASLCLRLSSIPVPNVQADGTCFIATSDSSATVRAIVIFDQRINRRSLSSRSRTAAGERCRRRHSHPGASHRASARNGRSRRRCSRIRLRATRVERGSAGREDAVSASNLS